MTPPSPPQRPDDQGDLRDVGRGARSFLLGQGARRAFQFGLLYVLARAMGEGPLGLFMVGASLVQLAGFSLGAGIRDALVREFGVARVTRPEDAVQAARAGLKVALWTGFPLGGLIVVMAPFLAGSLYHKPDVAFVVAVAGATVPLMVVLHWALGILRALRRVERQVWVDDVLWPGLTLILAVALVWGRPTPGRAMMAVFLATPITVAAAVAWALLSMKDAGLPRSPPQVPDALPRFARLAFPLMGTSFLSTAGMWMDTQLLGALAPAEDLGVYGPVSRAALVLPVVLFAFNVLFSPVAASRLAHGGSSALKIPFQVVARWTFAGTWLGAVGLWVEGRDLLALFGPGFVRGYPSLLILVFAGLLNGSVGSVGIVLKMGGRQNWMVWNGIISQGIALTTGILLIPRMGLAGAAIAAAVGSVLLQGLMLAQVKIAFGLLPFSRGYLGPLMAGILALVVGEGTRWALEGMNTAGRLPLVALAMLVTFLLSLAILGLTSADREILQGVIRFRRSVPVS